MRNKFQLLLPLIAVFSFLSMSAQDNIHLFAEEGTVWSVGSFTSPYNLTNLDYLLMQGNTQEDEFDEDYYHIVRIGESYPPTIENTSIALYVKVFEDSILYAKLPEGTDYPLFDYKLEESDEADLYIFDFYTESFSPIHVEVESIEDISTLSGTKKQWNIVSTGGTYWIEGLGNKEGLIYANYSLNGYVGADYFAICAFNNVDHLYQNSIFDNCYITGIEQSKISDEIISIYPNPVSDNLTIKADKVIDNIELYDCTGKLALKSIVNTHEFTLSFNDMKHGIYYLKVQTANEIISKTVIML